MPRLFFGSLLITAVLLVLSITAGIKILQPTAPVLPGEPVPMLEAKEISRGEKHPKYSTSPPTSGWYWKSNLRDGFHTSSITDEQIVEALAAGKVAIAYNCQYKTQPFVPTKSLPTT